MKRYDWKTVIRPAGGAVLAVALLAGSPAGADWLVTREGGRVETRGVWEVKGKMVVFHTADGTLSSLRLSEVDLEASRAATAEVEQRRTQAATARSKPARRPSIVSLTDKDFRKVEPAAPAAAGTEAAAPAEASAPEEPAPAGLAVATWERGTAEPGGHAVVTGTLHNTSGTMATDIQLAVALYDETGRLIVRGLATVDSPALPAGQQSGFRAEFPGFYGFADARFEPSSVNLDSGPASSPAPAASGG